MSRGLDEIPLVLLTPARYLCTLFLFVLRPVAFSALLLHRSSPHAAPSTSRRSSPTSRWAAFRGMLLKSVSPIWFISLSVPIYLTCVNLRSRTTIVGAPLIDYIVNFLYVATFVVLAMGLAGYLRLISWSRGDFGFLVRYYCYHVGTILSFCSALVLLLSLIFGDFRSLSTEIEEAAGQLQRYRQYLQIGDFVTIRKAWTFLTICLLVGILFNYLFVVHPIVACWRILEANVYWLVVSYGLVVVVVVPLVFVLSGVRNWVYQIADGAVTLLTSG